MVLVVAFLGIIQRDASALEEFVLEMVNVKYDKIRAILCIATTHSQFVLTFGQILQHLGLPITQASWSNL